MPSFRYGYNDTVERKSPNTTCKLSTQRKNHTVRYALTQAQNNQQDEHGYAALFVKILYMTDLAEKLLSLRIFSYLCIEIAISAQI